MAVLFCVTGTVRSVSLLQQTTLVFWLAPAAPASVEVSLDTDPVGIYVEIPQNRSMQVLQNNELWRLALLVTAMETTATEDKQSCRADSGPQLPVIPVKTPVKFCI